MNKHCGKIVEYAVRRNGYNLSALAKTLEVNRRSLYNWFSSDTLKKPIIHQIGLIIRHDFSAEFPELFTTKDFESIYQAKVGGSQPQQITNGYWELKYIALLEKYHVLLINTPRQRMHGN